MNIDKNKQSILMLAGIVLCAILFFWIFIFAPKNKQMKELKKELNTIQEDINKIQKIAGEEGSLDIAIAKYNKKLNEYKLKIPVQEEATLRKLAELAHNMGIGVLSITPSKTVDSKLPVNIKGCRCKEMIITINLTASYKKLGDYLKVLKDDFPSAVRLNKLDMKKEGEEGGISKLSVKMEVTLYLMEVA